MKAFYNAFRKPILRKIARQLGCKVKGLSRTELIDLLVSLPEEDVKIRYERVLEKKDENRDKLEGGLLSIPKLIIDLIL